MSQIHEGGIYESALMFAEICRTQLRTWLSPLRDKLRSRFLGSPYVIGVCSAADAH